MDKIGRNEPCPCGSGKKYKHCCQGKPGNIIPFPTPSGKQDGGTFLVEEDENLTFMERQGTPNQATDVLHELRNALENQDFNSTAEMEDYESSNPEMLRAYLNGIVGNGLITYPVELGLLEDTSESILLSKGEYQISPLFKRLIHWKL